MPLLFAVTLFVSALLLFLVQPMVGKMMLPLLGGTPAVWNTCMVFFQAALLAGYAYAHAAPAWLGARRQALVHLALLLLPLLVLPVAVSADWAPPDDAHPVRLVFWLLALLGATVGLPFFVVSASAPLLQRWFAATGHSSARDPYFLYAASNLGSMLALFGYPLLVEPFLPLAAQSYLWRAGYFALVVLTALCAVYVWRSGGTAGESDTSSRQAPTADRHRPTAGRRLRWVALAFVPSSLMLGATTYVTTDVAAIPLLWVLPLALYLLSFILVFARLPRAVHRAMVAALPVVVLVLVFVMRATFTETVGVVGVLLVHLVPLFVVSMVCHGELAHARPGAEHLTEFYLLMSAGGVLGGLFNALVAPLAFDSVAEYPLTLVLACLLLPRRDPGPDGTRDRVLDFALPAALGVLTAALIVAFRGRSVALAVLLTYGLPAAACFVFAARPLRFGLGLGAVLLAAALLSDPLGQVVHRERGFFGVLQVVTTPERDAVKLVHGTTMHGQQYADPARRREVASYFHATGPAGQFFAAFAGEDAKQRVAVIGLGAGALASYAEAGQRWTYYEIDPAVERLARQYFTFLADGAARGVRLDVVLGDARLKMARAADASYDLVVLDAFSSDAIPVHLLTRQALELYLDKLDDGGVLLLHVSNRYLELAPVVARLAETAGLVGLIQHDDDTAPEYKTASTWVALARRREHLGDLANDPRWTRAPLEVRPAVGLWTDDFSNLYGVFRWDR